jgi:hypothetical protein
MTRVPPPVFAQYMCDAQLVMNRYLLESNRQEFKLVATQHLRTLQYISSYNYLVN